MGTRRPLRIQLAVYNATLGTDKFGDFIKLEFDLTSGSYATSVLREICDFNIEQQV